MQRRHEISDIEWERIKDILPPENKGEGRPSKSNRVMLNGMLWINKTGAPWRDLPERFGHGRRCIHVFAYGAKTTPSKNCSSTYLVTPICRMCLLIVHHVKYTNMPLAQKRG